jgi:hypothetical protein
MSLSGSTLHTPRQWELRMFNQSISIQNQIVLLAGVFLVATIGLGALFLVAAGLI